MKEKPTILICDDDEFISRMYGFKFESEGYTVVIANSGEKVIPLIKKIKPGLVILDLMMPVMSGFEVLEELRGDEDMSLKNVPIIAVSNLSQQSDVDVVMKYNFADILVKSRITPNELFEAAVQHIQA